MPIVPSGPVIPNLPTQPSIPNSIRHWVYSAQVGILPGRMNVNYSQLSATAYSGNIFELVNNKPDVYTYSTNKSYQYITSTVNVTTTSSSFSIKTPWLDKMIYANGATSGQYANNSTQLYLHYSKPTYTMVSNFNAIYEANISFTGSKGITNLDINELDFDILGYSYYKTLGYELQPDITKSSKGWYYDLNNDVYHWFDYVSGSPSNSAAAANIGYHPVGGPHNNKKADISYRIRNAIYRFVPYTTYNMSFNYQNTGNFPLKIYLSDSPELNTISWNNLIGMSEYIPPNATLLATLTHSTYHNNGVTYSSHNSFIPIEFYGLRGNKYLVFVGGCAGLASSSATFSSIYINDIKIEGGYHSGNNRSYLIDMYSTYSVMHQPLVGATYSMLLGVGNTINSTASLVDPGLSKVNAKIGNGAFRAGIWENGVWNSGWRYDTSMKEFSDIISYVCYDNNKKWRIEITGASNSVSSFNIGDNVAISNIVAIDINEERKLIKDYYTIIRKSVNSIVVEFTVNFPVRRVERDSNSHRIYITKNVWLSGGFLNGYFKGIWNYGLFKGFPLITEMYDSHWLDGVFDGGHFYSSKYKVPNFVDTILSSTGKVGLTFSSPHGLAIGDKITINKNNKSINPQYDGEKVVEKVVNEYHIITNEDWGMDSIGESGKIDVNLNSGLIQKVNFKSNNISRVTSNSSMDSNAVFVYNSWMDVVYDDTSASNIGKPQTVLNLISNKFYSENNLFGYITNDILDSVSSFRDSFSNTIRNYKLGVKYNIYNDYIGDAGNFDYDFGSQISIPASNTSNATYTLTDEQMFLLNGWTHSQAILTNTPNLKLIEFKRDSINYTNSSELLHIRSRASGGILDLNPNPSIEILNRTEGEIPKNRYTMVEFDLVTYSIPNGLVEYDDSNKSSQTSLMIPFIHFDNINIITRNTYIGGVTQTNIVEASYLPISKNINHIVTPSVRKVEYFFNKRNLSMNFMGNKKYTSTDYNNFYIDNLHLYEIDMIPFFQYFMDDNINKGVVVPYQGISPFIDYSDDNFIFINNISIGLDSINTVNSNTPVSGIGQGNVNPNVLQFNNMGTGLNFTSFNI